LDQTIRSSAEQAYVQLLQLARARLRHEQVPVSPGTLVHELYLQLQGRAELRFASRERFLAYAGQAMRSLLVDIARARRCAKRQADVLPLTAGAGVPDVGSGTPEQLFAISQALRRLGQIDSRLLRVAEMRTLLGLEVAEIASVLGVSEPTVRRDWQRCKAFLHEALGGDT
jgi:RNA polymerase sigma factor (TIGR02999 family)